MKITPKKKKPNEGRTTVYYHCSKIRQKRDSDKNSENDDGSKKIL